jgi:sugar phosphate isomerase/epimerase
MMTLSRRRFLATLPAALAGARLARAEGPADSRPRVRVGCQANAFPLKADDFPGLLAAARKMRDLGYEGFECNLRFVQGEFGRVDQARRQIADTGMQFIGPHMNMGLARDPAFPRWVESIQALGASCIFMSGEGGAVKGSPMPANEVRRKAETLNGIGRLVRPAGLVLAYHNHNPEFAFHNAEIDGLAEDSDPNLLHFLIDAGHAHLGGGDPAAFLRRYPKRIFGFHIKTYAGGEKHQVPLGKGDWGFEDLAAAIQATGWSGWVETEEGGGRAGGDTAAVAPDRAYIRRVFGV